MFLTNLLLFVLEKPTYNKKKTITITKPKTKNQNQNQKQNKNEKPKPKTKNQNQNTNTTKDEMSNAQQKKQIAALPAIVAAAKQRQRPRGVSVVLSPRSRGLRHSVSVQLIETADSPHLARVKQERKKKKEAEAGLKYLLFLLFFLTKKRKRNANSNVFEMRCSVAAQEKQLAAENASKCERCNKNNYQLKLTVEDLFELQLCTPCAGIILNYFKLFFNYS